MGQEGFSAKLSELMSFPAGGVYSKVLAKGERFNFSIMCLARGAEIDTHTSTKNGGLYVLRGKGTFILQAEQIAMEPGSFIFLPADAPHSVKAAEDLAFLLCLSA